MIKIYILIALALGFCAQASQAQQPTPDYAKAQKLLEDKAAKGWWWYEDPKKAEPEEQEPISSKPKTTKAEQDKKAEDPCTKIETWTADCGFVDPGESFEFQAKQRDALLERMTMSQNDPKAVENFQYYMKWATDKSIEIANIWQYNLTQNPELDPSVTTPINHLGLKLMANAKDSTSIEIFKALKDEALLFFFSRSDCSYCHGMAYPIKELGQITEIPVWNASLDSQCIPGFESHCLLADKATKPATILQVKIVPTVFLFIKPNTWIRISTGVADTGTMKARIVSFFSAYRTALLKGINNSDSPQTPSVDFSSPVSKEYGIGRVEPKNTNSPLPSTQDINKLLNMKAPSK